MGFCLSLVAHFCLLLLICFQYWFVPETTANSKTEMQRLKAELKILSDHVFEHAPGIKIFFQGINSLCDQKVINVWVNNPAAQRCPFCLCTPNQMTEALMDPWLECQMTPEACGVLCLSILHFGLNSLNAILHIGYNQDLQEWSAFSRDP